MGTVGQVSRYISGTRKSINWLRFYTSLAGPSDKLSVKVHFHDLYQKYYLHQHLQKRFVPRGTTGNKPILISYKHDLTPHYQQYVTPTCFGPQSVIFRGMTDIFSQPYQQNMYRMYICFDFQHTRNEEVKKTLPLFTSLPDVFNCKLPPMSYSKGSASETN